MELTKQAATPSKVLWHLAAQENLSLSNSLSLPALQTEEHRSLYDQVSLAVKKQISCSSLQGLGLRTQGWKFRPHFTFRYRMLLPGFKCCGLTYRFGPSFLQLRWLWSLFLGYYGLANPVRLLAKPGSGLRHALCCCITVVLVMNYFKKSTNPESLTTVFLKDFIFSCLIMSVHEQWKETKNSFLTRPGEEA